MLAICFASLRLTVNFAKQASDLLRDATWARSAPCCRCGSCCQLVPQLEGRIWLEVAGVVCVGFSNMGKRLKWLGAKKGAGLG